jgi:uncharacterized membrane protein YeaQ/YmgE (transglycosylase-associated protein family)
MAWITIGLIGGWLANQILGGSGGGLLHNLGVGLVGALRIVPEPGFLGNLISATMRHCFPADLPRNETGVTPRGLAAAHPPP